MSFPRRFIPIALLILAAGAPTSIALMNTALAALLAIWIFAATADERQAFLRALIPFVPWGTALFLSTLFAPEAKLLYLVHYYWNWLAFPLVFAFAPQGDRKLVFRVFFIALSIAAGLGILQHIAGIRVLEWPVWIQEIPAVNKLLTGFKGGTRAKGFFFTPMTFGAILMFSGVALTYFLRSRTLAAKSWTFTLMLNLAALVVSSSRNAWLGLLAGVPVVLGRSARAWAIAGATLAVCAGLLFTMPVLRARALSIATVNRDPNSSTGARLFLWQDAWEQFKERPVLGWGAGTFSQNVAMRNPNVQLLSSKHAHNNYLQALAETGLVGLLGFLGTLAALGMFTRRGEWRLALGILASFVMAGFFESSYLDSEVMFNLFIWLALSATLRPTAAAQASGALSAPT